MPAMIHSPIIWISAGLLFLALETFFWKRWFLSIALAAGVIGICQFVVHITMPVMAASLAAAAGIGYAGRRKPRKSGSSQRPAVAVGDKGKITETIRGKGLSGAVIINGNIWIAFADERITIGLPIVVVRKDKNHLYVKEELV